MQYSIYKGVKGKFGAVQFDLKSGLHRGETDDRGNTQEKDKPGCIFVNITCAAGPNKYDWDQQIKFALGAADIGKILLGLRKGNEVSLVHVMNKGKEQEGPTKTFKLSKGESYGWFLNMTEGPRDGGRNHGVPISDDEALVLATLLQDALPKIFKWGEPRPRGD